MAATLYALTLGTAVWVGTQGLGSTSTGVRDSCSSEAFASALKAQRPAVVVRVWHPEDPSERPPDTALWAKLTQRGADVALDVGGAGKAVARTLSASEGCERNVATAALILDGALDELEGSAGAPSVDSLAPPVPLGKQLHVAASVGSGVEQGMFGAVPVLALAGALRYRYLELTLDVDVGLASKSAFTISPPEVGSGSVTATPLAAELGAGLAPRLGPGRLSADAGVGLSMTSVSVESTSVFQQRAATVLRPFGALRLGYALDLPWSLFLTVRAEERLAPTATFQVQGAEFAGTAGQSSVATRPWTFLALGLLGYHFS